MANKKYELSDEQLKQIIAEVESEVETMLKSEKPLVKAEPDDEKDKAPEKKEPAPAAEAAAAPPAPEAAPAPAPEAPPAPPAEAAPAPEMGADPAAQGGLDPEALKAEYAALPPEEIKMHFMAVKEVLFNLMGGHGEADPVAPPESAQLPGDAGLPPAAPAMGKMELEAIQPTKADKGEDHLAAVQANGKLGAGEDRLAAVQVKKSEEAAKEIETLKKSLKDQEDALGKLVGAFKTVLERPERKAVTSVAALGKPGDAPEAKPLNKSEVMAKLSEKARDRNLKKSDRDLINAYCVGGIDLKKIEHLLK